MGWKRPGPLRGKEARSRKPARHQKALNPLPKGRHDSQKPLVSKGGPDEVAEPLVR
jgi:hypothetical protein